MAILILFACIVTLVLLIAWAKVNTFLAFLLVSAMAALLLRMPLRLIPQAINKGLGDTLGSLVIVIVLGAMLGKLVAHSGAAQKIATVLKNTFGYKYVTWAMSLTGFIVGIPLFYNVGFVLLIPIIFSVAYNYKLPLVYVGLPMLASLSVMHGFVPPHPSPMALVVQFHADLAKTFIYGIIVAIPAIIIAGPLFAITLKNMRSSPTITLQGKQLPDEELPGIAISIISALLPVLIIGVTTLMAKFYGNHVEIKNISDFIGEPIIAMILTICIATYTLGISMGKKITAIMAIYVEAVKDIAMILLIIGSAGILKQIFVETGVSTQLAGLLQGLSLPPLFLAWLITAVLRLCLGSATIAGLTAAGIVYPLLAHSGVDASLMVLSVGAGSLFCSHVNDTSFWLFKEYLGLSMKQTFLSWSLMETLVSVIGLIGVMLLNTVIK
ncbi:gluconate:H+ symporter [Mucilaginibacter polytrichastri]|uniref:High-affinity gluconate transporter n=1 Tax=Mucilaginibacter polytrichastri TaxID=1302689 RepID=A0A1Q5ZXA0_9SPHI|nr:gluconate:H+ symporter [Mucilaginibacter polytrichastri]OKS86379.1 High-affinity gluconate transporter [Mucilaginibacter polytrichastri]SFT20822.1 Gnt-I system high-affinity gluconate transporter [Mucilaginibacter polytrichastri]